MLRVHVMTVPGADPMRDALVRQLGQEHGVEACIHPDNGRRGPVWTWAQALRCATHDEWEWSVVVQDDMRGYPGWQEQLALACIHSPSPILGLNWIGAYARKARDRGAAYLTGPYVLRGGAVAYRHDVVPALADFAAAAARTTYRHDDVAASVFAKDVLGTYEAVTGSNLFEAMRVRSSLVGHAQYPSGEYTINDWEHVPFERKTFVTTRAMARREDEGLLLRLIGEVDSW
jgi:hypothetical protein